MQEEETRRGNRERTETGYEDDTNLIRESTEKIRRRMEKKDIHTIHTLFILQKKESNRPTTEPASYLERKRISPYCPAKVLLKGRTGVKEDIKKRKGKRYPR